MIDELVSKEKISEKEREKAEDAETEDKYNINS